MIIIKTIYKKQKQDNVPRSLNPFPPIITIRTSDIQNGIIPSAFSYNSRNAIFIPQNNILKPTYSGEAPPPYPGILGATPTPNPNNSLNPTTSTNQHHTIPTPIIMRLYDNNNQNYQATDPPPYEDLPGSTNTSLSAIFFPSRITPDPSHVLPQK
ncbi:Hypothetical protein SRAE_2000059000 [Strongyloides ratti]|uniref:Uncharacterized protein n=1 Tax=Strongyloides ratti TaxID=34506 RepID=A0A090L7Y3_STRRB|nr:Hypothetical protein SRAE_2000059000 [Strongyloides ratti]CEF65916.1 Hypothetical protein SRAE_2000059000 [Strongyloides ratti]